MLMLLKDKIRLLCNFPPQNSNTLTNTRFRFLYNKHTNVNLYSNYSNSNSNIEVRSVTTSANKKSIKTNEPTLYLSNEAIQKMKEINEKYENSKALKIRVEAGGCSGFQYSFELIDKKNLNEKEVIVYNKECVVIIDKHSAELLKNSKVHYLNNIIYKKFTIENIENLSSKCSCGNSFDINF
ncbi:iron-sulfur assembly protein, putative [Hepatocystis sp. ex Piliocolobus tephrosceles]|nr:iron-sulfur assembly protein, putative [Hepatocystis sp. ex Piliocolobus tephrosceles]